jgi:hypothetical protein
MWKKKYKDTLKNERKNLFAKYKNANVYIYIYIYCIKKLGIPGNTCIIRQCERPTTQQSAA